MWLIYKLATNSYVLLVHLLSPFIGKARKWSYGRSEQVAKWKAINNKEPLIWFHCASLGEFEQGKPVIEAFKSTHKEWKILITFFSPSGYDLRADYELADYVFYLPIERSRNVKWFLEAFNPQIAVFVKYEFWYGYMAELSKRSIPLVFVSSTFRPYHIFFKSYGRWFLKQLEAVRMFFVQDKESEELLRSKSILNVEVSGDTRFDRVIKTVRDNEDLSYLKAFNEGYKVLIFGSAWERETAYFLKIVKQIPDEWKVIYAPHEISENKLQGIMKSLEVNSVRYSQLNEDKARKSRILLVDTVGHLARMYKYSDAAFIGGGYRDGIHNILEPLSFGNPVFFGGNHQGFGEGEETKNLGIGIEVSQYEDFEKQMLKWFDNPVELNVIQKKCESYIEERVGATKIIVDYLNKLS